MKRGMARVQSGMGKRDEQLGAGEADASSAKRRGGEAKHPGRRGRPRSALKQFLADQTGGLFSAHCLLLRRKVPQN